MRERAFLTAAMLLFVLAACSRSGPSGTAAPAAAGPLRITIGELNAAASHTPLYVAIQEGFFTKAGLDVSIQQLSGGTPAAMAAMATGSVNTMYAGANEFIQYAAKKVIAGKIIAEVSDSTFDIVVARGITSVAQLKGKTLGISGPNGADQIYLEALLPHYGLTTNDVSFVTGGSAANRLTALSAGAVQAIAVANATRDVSEKVGTVLLTSNDSPVQLPVGLIFANADLIANHREELQKFLRVLVDAVAWTRAHENGAVGYCTHGTALTADACQNGIATLTDARVNNKYNWSSTLAINLEGVKAALEIEARRGAEARDLALNDLVDTSFTEPLPQ